MVSYSGHSPIVVREFCSVKCEFGWFDVSVNDPRFSDTRLRPDPRFEATKNLDNERKEEVLFTRTQNIARAQTVRR